MRAAPPVARAELDEGALTRWGRRLGEAALADRVLVGLHGELGAGKTTLARAACAGAGVVGHVPSPTFTLVHVHAGRHGLPVYHVDLYRLRTPDELREIGWSELVEAEGPVFVEWAERAEGWLPLRRWEVRLGFAGRPDRRTVEARSLGGAPPIPEPEAGC